MDRKQTLKLAAVTWLLGFAVLSPAMAEDYEILLTRPSKPGQKVQISGTARDSEKTVLSGGFSRTTETIHEVRLKALQEVLEVDAIKRSSKVSLTIETLVLKANGKESTLLPKGAKVLATAGKEGAVFEVGGKPASQNVKRALSLLISLDGNSRKPTDDEMYGSKARKRVGEVWAVNKENLAASLREDGMEIRKEDVSGAVKLEGMTAKDTTPSLLMSMRIDLNNLKMPEPEGLTIKKASSTITGTVLVPVDTTKGILRESQEASRTIRAKGLSQDGKEILVESVGMASHTIEYAYPASSRQE